MNINYRNFVSFAMTLQILILLFATAVIPAAAVEDPSPLPLILQGTVEVDGKPASENTIIIAKVNGDDVGSVAVGQDGIYGQPGNKLVIDCKPENYGDIKFYVNGVESQLVDANILQDAKPGDDFKSVNMVATSSVSPVDNSDGGNGGSGGFSGTATTSDSSTNDESSSESTASASTTSLKSVATTESTDDSAEEVPASETGSSMMIIVIGAIILLGIIITVGYKLKEN